MSFSQYQAAAVNTLAGDLDEELNLAVLGLGLTGEAGEVADIIKKIVGHKHPLDADTEKKLLKELGDVLWYIATLCESLGFNLYSVAEENIAKLKARYPEGFSTERSINRFCEHPVPFVGDFGEVSHGCVELQRHTGPHR